ncbi:MAG: hypothetical protein IJP33_02820 [Firmicutes bacterium]|nr:hypothetical protein [Bacillota bacterium]
MKTNGLIYILLMALCMLGIAACTPSANADLATAAVNETDTAADKSTAVSGSTAAATTVVEAQTSVAELSEPADAQLRLDVASQFTIDLTEEEAEWYYGNTFIELFMYPGLHWAPQLLVKNWEKNFAVHDLTLEYDDPVYGKVDLCFTGSRIHDIFMSDIYFRHYPDCTLTEMDGTEYFYKKEAIENQEVYLVALCEGRPFGLPSDEGGTGPFWVIRANDGKAEILAQNISMLKATLPQQKDLPAL